MVQANVRESSTRQHSVIRFNSLVRSAASGIANLPQATLHFCLHRLARCLHRALLLLCSHWAGLVRAFRWIIDPRANLMARSLACMRSTCGPNAPRDLQPSNDHCRPPNVQPQTGWRQCRHVAGRVLHRRYACFCHAVRQATVVPRALAAPSDESTFFFGCLCRCQVKCRGSSLPVTSQAI
jgi:hypothetical protein